MILGSAGLEVLCPKGKTIPTGDTKSKPIGLEVETVSWVFWALLLPLNQVAKKEVMLRWLGWCPDWEAEGRWVINMWGREGGEVLQCWSYRVSFSSLVHCVQNPQKTVTTGSSGAVGWPEPFWNQSWVTLPGRQSRQAQEGNVECPEITPQMVPKDI